MHKIEAPGATQDNTFTEGNPSTGTEATTVGAAWLNAVQGEIVKVIESLGISLKTEDTETSDQLLAALNRLAARNVTSVAAADSPKALTVAEAGLVLVDASAGSVEVTLPPSAGNGGLRYTIARLDSSANTVTIDPDGTVPDTIEGAASLSLAVGRRVVLAADGGSDWKAPVLIASDAEAQAFAAGKLIDGSALSEAFKGDNQSLAPNGYQLLPGDLIFQWGSSATSSSATFPIEFPTQCFAVVAAERGTPAGTQDNGLGTPTTTGFGINGANNTSYFFAIGH